MSNQAAGKEWLKNLERAASLAGSRAEALHQIGACDALMQGELGAEAFEVALRMGVSGWPWVESTGSYDAGARGHVLRALWLGRHVELSQNIVRLCPVDTTHVIEAAGGDARVSDDAWWSLFVSCWPSSLTIRSLPKRACSDWTALANRASRSTAEECERAGKLLDSLMEMPDDSGVSFGSAWIKSACERGFAVQQCAQVLGERISHARRESAMSLALGAGAFARAQEDQKLSGSWESYWCAWSKLNQGSSADVELWEAWIGSYCQASAMQSVAARRAATPAALWEALGAHAMHPPLWPPIRARAAFEKIARAARAHFDAWEPTPGEPSAFRWACQRSKIKETIGQWACVLGEDGMQGALAACEWWPELASIAEAQGLLVHVSCKTEINDNNVEKKQSVSPRL